MNVKNDILLIISSVFILFSCNGIQTDIFVSPKGDNENIGTKENPFRTIDKALEKAKALRTKTKKNITILLLEGDFHLSSPLSITPAHNDISIVGVDSRQVSIKGSTVLSASWKKFNSNIWVTDVKDEIDFDQLFINGEKQILARYPNYDENGGYWQGHAPDVISKERVSNWRNPAGGFVHAMHSGRWGGFHFQITGVNEEGEVTLKGGHQNNRPSPMHPELRMVENVFEELDREREWYFDKKEAKLYIWPSENTDLNKAIVEVSTLKHLIEIIGSEAKPVKGVTIHGIQFEHTKRTIMDEYHQLLRSDWTIYRGGAVLLEGTESCTINNCEFSNLGGNVIFVNGYNRMVEIIENHIHDCGATAISFVGDTSAVRSPSYQYSEFVPIERMDTTPGPANNRFPSECKVVNNLIYRIGRIEKQVAGVQISMAMNIHLKHNSIYEVPRAGINISEGTWGGHLIEYNDVFNTVLESGDHGAFNSWGRDRFWHPHWNRMDSLVKANPKIPYWDAIHTTIIRNNRFRCDHGWDIDLDDGSSNYHIYDNLCLNGGIKLREGYYRVVENNIMVNNGFHPHVWFDNSEDIFRKNIMMTKHFPIRLRGWGKEVDFNLFPDSMALRFAHENQTDRHSLYGNPNFVNPEKGNFSIAENSPAFEIGFKNFSMDSFGVQKKDLKSMAKQPDFPELNIASFQNQKKSTKKWLGGTLKNIETLAEQSASGLHHLDGILVLNVKENSKLAISGITNGDVIVGIEGQKVKNISDLLSKYQENLWHGKIRLNIIRHQEERDVLVVLQ